MGGSYAREEREGERERERRGVKEILSDRQTDRHTGRQVQNSEKGRGGRKKGTVKQLDVLTKYSKYKNRGKDN